MADVGLNLNSHDQVLVNALMALTLPVIEDPANNQAYLHIIRRALPYVNRGHYYIEPLADWAENLIATERDRGPQWHRAHFQIKETLAAFAKWRLGLVMDSLRAAKEAKEQARKEDA